MTKLLAGLLIWLLSAVSRVNSTGYEHFYGGSMSYSVIFNNTTGKYEAHIDLITGWKLGKGPCGPSCKTTDVGKDTRSTRMNYETNNHDIYYFGNWSTETGQPRALISEYVNTEVKHNIEEHVMAVSEIGEWEQEHMKTKIVLKNIGEKVDVLFEGLSWRNLPLQTPRSTSQLLPGQWHLQSKIDVRIRSDTGQPNASPRAYIKPFYRIKLNSTNHITIPAIDPEGDFVKCKPAYYVEGGVLSVIPIPGLSVSEACIVTINTSLAFNYTDDMWGGIAVTVHDYNKEEIYLNGTKMMANTFALGGTTVQFLVQVLENLHKPEFIPPTKPSNHRFYLYNGATLSVDLYAKGTVNTTINEFKVLGRQGEQFNISNIKNYTSGGNHVKYATVSWKPQSNDIGSHIICVEAVDNSGVDSAKDRCFIIEAVEKQFHATNTSLDKPYFVDLPFYNETLRCVIDVTCVFPIYVNSSAKIVMINVEGTLDFSSIGEITQVVHHGFLLYEGDLSLMHDVHGPQNLCLTVKDVNGISSEKACINLEIVPTDPCESAPCLNSGQCTRRVNDTADYECKCINDYQFEGKNCDKKEFHDCNPNPCVHGRCIQKHSGGHICYCKGSRYTGDTCSIVEGNDYQQFYGASLSYAVNETDDPNVHEVHMLLISGWVLSKGPCGQSCSEVDVGRDTNQTRQMMTTDYGETFFGQWFEEYKGHSSITLNITRDVVSNMTEKVFGVNIATQWEQEMMTTKFLFNSSNIPKKKVDIKYEGDSWRNRTNQNNRTSTNGNKWNLQSTVNLGVRSDTGKPNRSPVVFAKPYYRLLLDDVNEIHIAAFDSDGDFVKCKQSVFGVALTLSANPLKGLTVLDSCTIRLNTSSALGYKDDFWGGIAVAARDYNKHIIYIGGDKQLPGFFSIGGTPVQFLVQVLKKRNFPKFVNPTLESNHEFTIYTGASWTVTIYAEAVENAVIRQFYSYGLQNETILHSDITDDDLNRDQVKKIQVSWTPNAVDVGGHIICTRAIDNTGVDSSKDKCFIVKVIERAFNASSTRQNQSIPYFINLPTDVLAVVCEEEKTCALPIYVNSSNKIKEVRITTSGLDLSEIGKEITNIGDIYKTDLFMRHSAYGQQTICLVATDSVGFSSDETCIFVEIEAQHPCYSRPCVNSGECRRHVNDTSDYQCVNCPSGFSGRNCEIKDLGFCDRNPCNGQVCLKKTNTCYCKLESGFTGPTCSINIDDCQEVNCSNHGVCKDRINDYTCKCFKRYNGSNCETDRCPLAPAHDFSCPGDSLGCVPNQCTHGICNGNNTCLCNLGYSGDANCTQALGNLGNTYSNVTILPPTLKARSTITCYTAKKCIVKLYFTVSNSANVQISVIKVTEKLKYNTSTSSSLEWNEIDGLDGMMTGDVSVISNEEMQGYICAQVDDGASQDSRCFALNFISNPMNVTSSAEYIQKDRAIKFISPTPSGESTIVCRKNELCYIMLYTSLNTTGLCDLPISTDEGVTVLEVRNFTNGCLSQVAILMQTKGNHHVCLQSTMMSSEAQTRCFRIQVYDTDPCLDGKCQNNAICLYNGDASDNTACACEIGYRGVHCERGPCQAADNNCLHGYCEVNDHNTTCICPIGIKGDRCQTSIPNGIVDLTDNGAQFTDIALPSLINCVRNRLCSVPLIASGTEIPNIRPGYTSSYIDIADIGIQRLENGSYLVNLNLIGHRVGLWDTCVLAMNNMSVNKDELCFKVNVEKGTSSVYSEKDKPHFTDPSVPPNSDLVCKVNESCHLFMNATLGGQFVSTECVELSVTVTPQDVTKYHIFSTCETCTNGSSSIKYCQFDVAMYLTVDVDLCLQARTTTSKVVGEKRCYHLSSTPEIAKKGCQVLHCKNGGFCDGHVEPAKCHCPAMFNSTMCETDLSSNLSSSKNHVLTGGGGVPNEVVCQLGKACEILHSVLDSSLTLTTGYIAPGLKTNSSSITSGQSTLTVYSGSPGKKVLCLQALQGSLVKDEQCMTVNFVANGGPSVDKEKPYFIAPTPPSKSVILCSTNSSCHLDIHFPKGNLFRSALTCPALSEISTTPVDGVYIFPSTENPTDCSSDVSYITPYVNKDTEQDLCLQVSLPGKRGEERCFVILIVPNITNTVTRPCSGMTCENSAVCVADLSVQPSTGNCICQSGYIGADCSQVNQSVTKLPGYLDTSSSKNSTQSDKTPHFDQTSGIPSNVVCIENRPCTVQITYRGDANKPPLPGYISSPLSVSNITVASTLANGTHIALYTVTNIHAGVHKSCFQTTLNGSRNGLNLDEICFNITVSAGSSTTPPSSAGSNFGNSAYSNGSTLSCQIDSVCHLSFVMKGSPNCELRECGVGVPGLHVFDIQHGTSCLTDVAIKTGNSSTFHDICLLSGGEERHIQVEIRNKTEYGPCQRLHCVNGGFCNASDVTPVCECTSRFSGSECKIGHCDKPLPNTDHGNFMNNINATHGQMIMFACDTGFKLTNPTTNFLTCDASSNTWTGTLPKCVKGHCTTLPPAIDHGLFKNATDVSHGERIMLTCETGYELTDPTVYSLVCDSSSNTWTGTHPACTIKVQSTCRTPFFPSAIIPVRTYHDKDIINVTCLHGYVLKDPGSATLICNGSSNTWNGTVDCIQKVCSSKPPPIPNTRNTSTPEPFIDGFVVNYTCVDGYKFAPQSSNNLTCNATSDDWIGPKPICIEGHCDKPLPQVDHGNFMNGTNATHGQKILFVCYTGFELTDPATNYLDCDASSNTWTGTPPKCVKGYCTTRPPTIDHGQFKNSTNVSHGEKILLTCDAGYELTDPTVNSLVCDFSSNTWTGTRPDCTIKAVSLPPSVTYNVTNTSAVSFPPSVIYNVTSTSAVSMPPSVTYNVTNTSAVSDSTSVTYNTTSTPAVSLPPSVTYNVTSTSAVSLPPSVTYNVKSTSALSDTTSVTYNTTSTSAVSLPLSVTYNVTSTSAVSDATSVTYNTTSTSDVCTGEAARGAAQRAKQVVKSGKVSCFCIVRGPDNVERRVQIIKRRPKMTVAQILKHAGYGAGAMTGGLLICLVLYHVVRRQKKLKSQDRVQRIKKTPQRYME